jgi:tRNA(fMet)-specific endonuclease VapC
MNYLLDTNICIELIRQKSVDLRARLIAAPIGNVGVSAVTVAELEFGVHKSRDPARERAALAKFLTPLVVHEFGVIAAATYGQVRFHLERIGTPIGPLDMMIAAHSLSLGTAIVTKNVNEFRRVPGLIVDSWDAPAQ